MKTATLIAAIAAGALFAGPAAAEEAKPKGEAELAKLLEGRVAGEPQNCVQTFPSTNMRIIDGTAIVIERGSTLYVNIPQHPESLDDDDAMKIRRTSNQLCRSDIVTTFDRTGGFYTGNIFLGDFVPYKKVEG
ncbi:hypothetical protein [Pelagerythrobacter aerophilus]|uniref:Uncharacterized protein n=1 Tax=Pelagerythrobacter aerophilus TaxID=2306995 RepID=A0A418NF06_9SPHN|nr:hypothetical protein [Pelagerythrobacter aerophilus]RIV75814.1 hypothetical protein D2V04_16225 [Pelagerythrobacter aerophilus]